MKKIKFLLFLITVLGMIAGSVWYVTDNASKPGLKDYVGDEVWYVPAARNVLHRLGLQVHYVHNGYEGVNVIFSNDTAKLKYRHFVDEGVVRYHGNVSATLSYKEFPGMYVEVPQEKLDGFLSYMEDNVPNNAFYIVTGYRYPDKENIQNYLNTEHPFLGKDLIMASMILLGDEPFYWRVPGIVVYALLQILVVLTAYRITKSYLAPIIALIFVAGDPLLQATSITAMLDIYVAGFVALFTFLLTMGWKNASGFGIGLSAATKLSGAFGYPVLFFKLVHDLRDVEWKRAIRIIVILGLAGGTIVAYAEYLAGYWDVLYFQVATLALVVFLAEFVYSSRPAVNKLLLALSAGVFLPLVGFFLPELTIIRVMGLKHWLRDFLGSFKWHLSYKGDHPYTSPFWQWFYNGNPFHLHFNPDVVASTDPTLLILMVIAIFAVPYVVRRNRDAIVPLGVFWSTVSLFALQYALGGKTQFSFYATALIPEAGVVAGVFIYDVVKWEAFTESLLDYLYWIGRLARIKRITGYVERKRVQKEEKVEKEPEFKAVGIYPSIPLPPTVYVELKGLPKKGPKGERVEGRRPRPGGLPKKGSKADEEKSEPANGL